jgi:hypothetical protein
MVKVCRKVFSDVLVAQRLPIFSRFSSETSYFLDNSFDKYDNYMIAEMIVKVLQRCVEIYRIKMKTTKKMERYRTD